ncbi:FAD-binding protein [Pseudohalocynthiibacter sp. F2068]|jgi:flavocytochrome c|uniref:FAD-dependent oxidoreductase n=1 Tax=Pseudohalocynthiibacter sp. F2068 TaxID=2926418 RepID=UPI001FF50BFE|nr:FAD-binding protein [Pseudohalocynthiibacter sp. F2068]MCK0100695.1 FAD-binding protein [Pseudohalocynthiibacter sp. F2068]
MSETLDLLVIGAGACGLAGAIAAHDAGGTVAILEGRDRPGGNSALSTGSIPGAGSKYQRAAGIEDSPERMVEDLIHVAGHHDADDLTEMIAAECGPLCEWLIDDLGARMELITAYRHVGHSVERLHAPRSRRGQDLVDDLLRFVADRDIPIAVGNRAEALLVEDGHVVGAVVGGEPIRARKVLLATNGFAADPTLVAEHCAEIAAAEYFGAPGSTGDAVRWGQALGAALGNMGAYQGYAAVAYPQGQLLSWTTLEKGGVLVSKTGRRFGNEDLGYSGFASHVMKQGAFAWAIYDARIHAVAEAEEEYAEMSAMGAVTWADTPGGVAEAVGLDSAGLEETIAAYNAAARGEGQDACGRTAFSMAPLEAPFAAVKVKPGLFHTQGGLLVDTKARVRKASGGIVPNLFAGGGAAAGISGRDGALGYASGNGLITALVLGRRAGMVTMEEIKAVA